MKFHRGVCIFFWIEDILKAVEGEFLNFACFLGFGLESKAGSAKVYASVHGGRGFKNLLDL